VDHRCWDAGAGGTLVAARTVKESPTEAGLECLWRIQRGHRCFQGHFDFCALAIDALLAASAPILMGEPG
jgi:hypothetical protein